jgi:hypothetical protein
MMRALISAPAVLMARDGQCISASCAWVTDLSGPDDRDDFVIRLEDSCTPQWSGSWELVPYNYMQGAMIKVGDGVVRYRGARNLAEYIHRLANWEWDAPPGAPDILLEHLTLFTEVFKTLGPTFCVRHDASDFLSFHAGPL